MSDPLVNFYEYLQTAPRPIRFAVYFMTVVGWILILAAVLHVAIWGWE